MFLMQTAPAGFGELSLLLDFPADFDEVHAFSLIFAAVHLRRLAGGAVACYKTREESRRVLRIELTSYPQDLLYEFRRVLQGSRSLTEALSGEMAIRSTGTAPAEMVAKLHYHFVEEVRGRFPVVSKAWDVLEESARGVASQLSFPFEGCPQCGVDVNGHNYCPNCKYQYRRLSPQAYLWMILFLILDFSLTSGWLPDAELWLPFPQGVFRVVYTFLILLSYVTAFYLLMRLRHFGYSMLICLVVVESIMAFFYINVLVAVLLLFVRPFVVLGMTYRLIWFQLRYMD